MKIQDDHRTNSPRNRGLHFQFKKKLIVWTGAIARDTSISCTVPCATVIRISGSRPTFSSALLQIADLNDTRRDIHIPFLNNILHSHHVLHQLPVDMSDGILYE
jgi:hypothetical protein